MKVLSEEKLCVYLNRVLDLSKDVAAHLSTNGTQQVDDDTLDRYHQLVNDLSAEREQDSLLNEESWNWIWESRSSFSYIKVYGRLAWINLQLLELL